MAIIFFAAVINLLYYMGAIQMMIRGFGFIMEALMDVGPVEAFGVAANIFLGPVSIPVL